MPETKTNAPTCATQKCKRPLTWLGPPQNCWRCLVCNPITETRKTETPKRKYIDVTLTEDMIREIIKEELSSVSIGIDEDKIREIVQDELANWHIQKPPLTASEVVEAVGTGDPESNVHIDVQVPKPETLLQKAKRRGVRTHNEGTGGMRKKIDIMADMERLDGPPQEKEPDAQIPKELRTEEQG